MCCPRSNGAKEPGCPAGCTCHNLRDGSAPPSPAACVSQPGHRQVPRGAQMAFWKASQSPAVFHSGQACVPTRRRQLRLHSTDVWADGGTRQTWGQSWGRQGDPSWTKVGAGERAPGYTPANQNSSHTLGPQAWIPHPDPSTHDQALSHSQLLPLPLCPLDRCRPGPSCSCLPPRLLPTRCTDCRRHISGLVRNHQPEPCWLGPQNRVQMPDIREHSRTPPSPACHHEGHRVPSWWSTNPTRTVGPRGAGMHR